MSSELTEKISRIMETPVPSRHSLFQLKYFVIGKEPTIQSKLWQCMRELKARHESLQALQLEIEDTRDNLELLEIDILDCCHQLENCTSNAAYHANDIRKKEIEIKKLNRKKFIIDQTLKQLEEKRGDIEIEARFFMEIFHALSQVEPLKPFDDLESQKEYWNERLSQDLNMKVLLQHPLDNELVKTILALDNEMPIKKKAVQILDGFQVQLLNLKEKYLKSIDKKD